MGQGWFCPVCEEVLSMARIDRGECVLRPREPTCPLKPPGVSADAPTGSPQAPPLKAAA